MAKFKVGDIITGLSDNTYGITNSHDTFKVVELLENDIIRIKTVTHEDRCVKRGVNASVFLVGSLFFKLVKPKTWKELLS